MVQCRDQKLLLKRKGGPHCATGRGSMERHGMGVIRGWNGMGFSDGPVRAPTAWDNWHRMGRANPKAVLGQQSSAPPPPRLAVLSSKYPTFSLSLSYWCDLWCAAVLGVGCYDVVPC